MRMLLIIFSILFLDNFGFTLAASLLQALLSHENFGLLSHFYGTLKSAFVGLVLIAFPLGMFIGAPFFGAISDYYGRKRAFFWTLSGACFGYCLTAMGILLKSYFLILASRWLCGFFSANLSLCLATISDLSKEKKTKAKSISIASSFLGLSWVLAILLGSFLVDPMHILNFNLSLPFWGVALLFAIAFLILRFFFHETVALPRKKKFLAFKSFISHFPSFEKKQLKILLLTLFFWFFGFYISLQWITPIALEIFHAALKDVLWILVLLGVFWTLSSALLNPFLIKEFSIWKILLWSLFLMSLFYFFSGITNFFFYFALSYLITAIFAAIVWSDTMSLIAIAAPKEERGESLGCSQAVMAIAQFFGPFFGGMVARINMEALFLFSSLFIFLAFLFLLVFIIQKRNSLIKSSNY